MGHPATSTSTHSMSGTRTVLAFLVWALLGLFGGHRLYAGKYVTSFVQLALALVTWRLASSPPWAPLAAIAGFVGVVWWGIDATQLRQWLNGREAPGSSSIAIQAR